MPDANQRLRRSIHDVIDLPWEKFGLWALVLVLGVVLDLVIRVS
jgi:hypothetical protein